MARSMNSSSQNQIGSDMLEDLRRRLLWLQENWNAPCMGDTRALPPVPKGTTDYDYQILFGKASQTD